MSVGDLVTITGYAHDPAPTAPGILNPNAQHLSYIDVIKGTTGLIIATESSKGTAAILLDSGTIAWFFADGFQLN